MDHSVKMYLVPSDVMSRLDTKRFSNLDKELYHALYATDMDDAMKWKNYSQILQKYLHEFNESTKPIEIQVIEENAKPTNSSDEEVKSQTNSEDKHKLVLRKQLPKTIREKGLQLFDYLQNQNFISWNSDGEVTLNQEKIEHSHIVDLICAAVRATSKRRPRGWDVFAKHLYESSIPRALLGKNIMSFIPPLPSTPSPAPGPTTSIKARRQKNRYNPITTGWKKYKI